jgi:hypothetical protein
VEVYDSRFGRTWNCDYKIICLVMDKADKQCLGSTVVLVHNIDDTLEALKANVEVRAT